MNNLSGKTTIVVGASRGLGHGIATAFAETGAPVVAVSRTPAATLDQATSAGTIHPEIADAGDPTAAASLLDRYDPEVIILVAGATPHMRPLQQQTWETFSVNWRPMSASRSTGCARHCSSRCGPAARSSCSAAAPR